MRQIDLLIIGGGPAGLAAAIAAWDSGCRDLLILERDTRLGGILQQCIHNGFGLHYFQEELTGPEYASRFVTMVESRGIPWQCDTMVLDISGGYQQEPHYAAGDMSETVPGNSRHLVTAVSPAHGLQVFQARAIILAMGCRERPRGALGIPGTRCAGIMTTGTAQRLTNLEGYMPGKRIVILGSGDIGLIMARRMTFEGAKVLACVEIMSYSSGLTRNVVQCLQDYNIPLLLNHTVVAIHGQERVTGVTVAAVDSLTRQPIAGTEVEWDCDTLLLSVGLIPENELSRAAGVDIDPATRGPLVDQTLVTTVPGIFACGNVLHVHDLVDHVSAQAEHAGRSAAAWLEKNQAAGQSTQVLIKTPQSLQESDRRLEQTIQPLSQPVHPPEQPLHSLEESAQPQEQPVQPAQQTARLIPVLNGPGVRGIVPQFIARHDLASQLKQAEQPERIEFSFRPTDVFRSATLVMEALDDNQQPAGQLLRQPRRILTPGEMASIVVTASRLADPAIAGLRLTVVPGTAADH